MAMSLKYQKTDTDHNQLASLVEMVAGSVQSGVLGVLGALCN